MTKYIGEIAGIATSFCFAANAVFITRASQKVGSVISNRTRVFFALIYLILLNLIFFRQPVPFSAGSDRWTWLALSGVIGLALGDAFLFQSYLLVGPRLGMLLLSLSTVIGVFEAWTFLGESLGLIQMTGIALTLGGIIWVVMEQGNGNGQTPHHTALGILFGILSAVCQATGLVLSKQGLYGDFPPIQGNVIRMLAAALSLWLVAAFQKEAGTTIQTLKTNPSALKQLAIAAFIGPVLGVSASLLSVQHTEVGVASVLTSLAPVFMLPVSHYIFKERLGWQAIAGTLLAMAGVTILFLS